MPTKVTKSLVMHAAQHLIELINELDVTQHPAGKITVEELDMIVDLRAGKGFYFKEAVSLDELQSDINTLVRDAIRLADTTSAKPAFMPPPAAGMPGNGKQPVMNAPSQSWGGVDMGKIPPMPIGIGGPLTRNAIDHSAGTDFEKIEADNRANHERHKVAQREEYERNKAHDDEMNKIALGSLDEEHAKLLDYRNHETD